MTTVTDIFLAAAMRLVNQLKQEGFRFERMGTDEDAPLMGVRTSRDYQDTVMIGGFSDERSCCAMRHTLSSLIIPGKAAVTKQFTGDALAVLQEVSEWQTE